MPEYPSLPDTQAKTLANRMVISKIMYCISVLANVTKGLKQKVQAIMVTTNQE